MRVRGGLLRRGIGCCLGERIGSREKGEEEPKFLGLLRSKSAINMRGDCKACSKQSRSQVGSNRAIDRFLRTYVRLSTSVRNSGHLVDHSLALHASRHSTSWRNPSYSMS